MKLNTSDLFDLTFRALGTNKLRSGLTILGVSIGVFSVVGVMTVLSAVRHSIDTGLNVFAANVFEISKYPAIRMDSGFDNKYRRRQNITPRQALEFADRMEEEGLPVTLTAGDSGERIRYEDKKTGQNKRIIGTNENFLLTNKYELNYGRNINISDLEFNRPVMVIGHEIEQELFPNENPLGKTIIAARNRYTVVGVLEKRGELFGNNTDNLVLIPITRFVANNWNSWRSMEMSVLAPSAVAMGESQDIAIGNFRQVRGLEPEEENDFEIYSNDSLLEAFAKIAVIIGTGGLVISAIALLCASVGIMSIMFVSVTERTREIGLRKSIGARKRDILFQFLLEAIALSLMGCFVGILLGWLVGNSLAAQMNVPMIMPWFWIGVAISVCTLIGVVFGFVPAWRASRLEPVEALRYE
ncbi:MAG: ABC transporter permease [Puniceicoccaceae bacterium]